jgi:hypothetical protein
MRRILLGRDIVSAMPSDLKAAVLAAITLGALSTMGDWIWARFIPDGAVIPGVVHGVLFFVALALVLGRAGSEPGATRRLLATLPMAGLLIAASFYPVAWAVGYLPALIVAWVAMWLSLAWLYRRAAASGESSGSTLARGVLAALGSGLAFWAVSGMWTSAAMAGANYPLRFLLWTLAFLPGFIALLIRREALGAKGST